MLAHTHTTLTRQDATGFSSKKSQKHGVCSVHSCAQLKVIDSGLIPNDQEAKSRSVKRFLYVSDPLAHRVAVFDTKDMSLAFFIGATTYGDQELCSNGFRAGELNCPTFFTFYHVKSESNLSEARAILVVSDSGNHTISLFDAQNGSFCGRIGKGFGHLDGFFDSPQGIDVWDNRLLFVCDQHNHRVQVFDLVTRHFVRAFGRLGMQPGEFNFPSGLALCPALPEIPKCNFGPHRSEKIVVADTGNHRVQILDWYGRAQLVLDVKVTPFDKPLSPVGVWVQQRSGYLLVSDVENHCVIIFTNTGEFLAAVGATGESDTRFVQPVGITIVSQYAGIDLLCIADARRCDISTFQLRM